MNKKTLTERDICTKYITPALRAAGWDEMLQVREEYEITRGRIIVRGKLVSRGRRKRADYVLSVRPNVPLAVIEAKDNRHSVGDGIQHALGYAEMRNVPFAFSSHGDGFVCHDRTGDAEQPEVTLGLDEFPSPDELWQRYRRWKGLGEEDEQLFLQDYHDDGSGKTPRYYQVNAVNAAIEAVTKDQDRVRLVMATGTGKTYTAVLVILRHCKAGRISRNLFIADRNVLVDETMVNAFGPIGGAMHKLSTSAKTMQRADGTKHEHTVALDSQRGNDTAYDV